MKGTLENLDDITAVYEEGRAVGREEVLAAIRKLAPLWLLPTHVDGLLRDLDDDLGQDRRPMAWKMAEPTREP